MNRPQLMPGRCYHCHGNLMLEETYKDGKMVYQEIRCWKCGRPQPSKDKEG